MNAPLLVHEYRSLHELAEQPSAWWDEVLGVVGFGQPPRLGRASIPVTGSMTPALGEDGEQCEVWRVAGASSGDIQMRVGAAGGVQFRHCGKYLFGSVTIAEQGFLADGAASASAALRQATELAYKDNFGVLHAAGYANLIRVWNYLPEINGDADGDERYRHFNSARLTAFRNSGRATEGCVPAASALGSAAGNPLSIYFLAARHQPTMIENPRELSAYHYPARYGRHQPIFSRACVLGGAAGTNLFVSGTASIVGHESIHPGDVSAQTQEALVNIDALIQEANRLGEAPPYTLDGLRYKVYVRHPADLPAIKTAMSERIGAAARAVYLHADVCRQDLLVEIEATGRNSAGRPA